MVSKHTHKTHMVLDHTNVSSEVSQINQTALFLDSRPVQHGLLRHRAQPAVVSNATGQRNQVGLNMRQQQTHNYNTTHVLKHIEMFAIGLSCA